MKLFPANMSRLMVVSSVVWVLLHLNRQRFIKLMKLQARPLTEQTQTKATTEHQEGKNKIHSSIQSLLYRLKATIVDDDLIV